MFGEGMLDPLSEFLRPLGEVPDLANLHEKNHPAISSVRTEDI